MNNIKQEIQQRLGDTSHPEHVESSIRVILKWIQEEAEFDEDEWIEVLEELKSELEFGEAEWLQ